MPDKDELPVLQPPIPSQMFGVPVRPENKGKCGSCGFLARMIGDSPNTVYREMDWSIRTGIQGLFKTEPEPKPAYPACFLHIIELMDKLGRRAAVLAMDGKPTATAMQDVFWDEIDCQHWFSYSLGMSPEKHVERYEMKRLELDRRDFELKLFAMNQKVQEDSKAIADSTKKIADSTKKITWWIGLIVIVLTGAQIFLGILGYLASRKPVYVPAPVIQQQPVEQPATQPENSK